MSPLEEFAKGEFQTGHRRDATRRRAGQGRRASSSAAARSIYDLRRRARASGGIDDVAILRIEQLYPFPHEAFAARDEALPECDRGGLVPGRAAEPGRLVPHPALPAAAHAADGPEARLRRRATRRRRRRWATSRCTRSSRRSWSTAGAVAPADRRPRAARVQPARRRNRRRRPCMLIEVKVPQLSESVAEATLLAWHKKPGEAVARDENLIDIETDKVVLETAGAGRRRAGRASSRATAARWSRARSSRSIDTEAKAAAAPRRRPLRLRQPLRRQAAQAAAAAAAGDAGRAQAAGREQGVDPAPMPGTGRDGRVTKGDVLGAHGGAGRGRRRGGRAPRPQPRAAGAGAGRSASCSASGPSSACRCRACARASPSGCCSRRRPPRS